MYRKLVFSIALILFPALLVFKSILLPGPLAWGDAPHFYPEMLKGLVNEPLAWTNRGYGFGGVNMILWLSPLMLLYGLMGAIIGNDLTVRILFYFPSIILSGISPYLLAKYLKLSKTVSFFSSLIYIFNTYFLLLIDGGQVGVALAYGIFPVSLLFLKKLFDSPSLKSFYLSLGLMFALSIADPRIAAICILTGVLWSIFELKIRNLVYLIPLGISLIALNMYWIFPFLKNSSLEAFAASTPSNFRWYEPFLLFSPNWPSNIFGEMARPPFYFIGVPILVFLGAVLQRTKEKIVLGLLFFAFALLAIRVPFIEKIPFAFAFRDTTKFFIPLILFGGILIGSAIDRLKNNLFRILCYIFILFLVWQAILGRMNFVLSGRQQSSDYQKIYENLTKDNSFSRTVWFPERNPLAYEANDHPAIDARDLANFWPFASINAGEDVFNFLNNQEFTDTFRLLGIKYLILSGNPREIDKTSKDQKDWDTINSLISQNQNLERLDWGTQVPIYKIDNSYPRLYAARKLVAVIGPTLKSNLSVPAVYFEDGKLNPHLLEGRDPSSAVLFFNGSDKTDLAMSFLAKYFVSPGIASRNEWAVYSKDQYLKYKYELLIRGIKFDDFDYGKGIAFSTKKGEKIEFEFNVPEKGEYIFLKRGGNPMKWESTPLTLAKGEYKRTIENESDIEILNTVALVPKKDFEDAKNLADVFTRHFKTVDEKSLDIKEDYKPVEMENPGTLKYTFAMPEGYFWLIFSDNYNKLWKFRQGDQYSDSLPVYSMVNGFYAEDKWTKIGIEFKGQENVRWGIYWSAVSILALAVIYLWFSSKEPKRKV